MKLFAKKIFLFLLSFLICETAARSTALVSETEINNKTDNYVTENEVNYIGSIAAIANEIESKSKADQYRLLREQYAKKMLSFMNQSIDPCDDFYEYACGNWKNLIIKRNTRKRRLNLLDLNFDLFDKVEGLLENPNEELKEKYAEELQKTRIFYKSCLEADLQKLPKSDVYLEAINHISGFPAIDKSWQPENFDWFNATAKISNYGIDALTKEDFMDQYPFPPFFKLIELGFEEPIRNDSVSNKTTSGYKTNEQIMREYLTTYGVVEPKTTEVVNSIFELWHSILNATVEFHDDVYKCREVGELQNITKWEKFDIYFEIAWNGLKPDDPISDCPCAYFYTKLDKICTERKEAVANYLALKFLYHMDARLLDADFQKDFCNEKVKNSMQFLLDQLYMAEYFQLEDFDELNLMTKEIRSSLREKLKSLDWLDDKTREEALFKESTIDFRIGRLEDVELMEKLIREIRNLDLNKDDYEKNNIEIAKFMQYMKRYNGLHFEELNIDTRPIIMLIGMQANGFYFNGDNSISMMSGMLRPPVYHKSWPLALKYGTCGALIGHELTHAFDTVGALFDGKGNENPWWTDEADKIFLNLTECYIEKFNNYKIPEIEQHINGNKTKDENIADHGGLRHAFNAYHNHIKKINIDEIAPEISLMKSEIMPGLDMTPEQLFYLGFAQIWCADYKEANYWEELKDEHTIDKYRVLGTLSNTKEFAEAYKCPVGSKMNPTENKCEIW